MKREIFKKPPEELEMYMYFKKRGGSPRIKKGKGSYTRKTKHKNQDY